MNSMKIHQLKIKGFKSIEEIVLDAPNPFSVFVGANGAGKSNIFEALEFLNYCNVMEPHEALKYFGKLEDLINKNLDSSIPISFDIKLKEINPFFSLSPDPKTQPPLTFTESSYVDFGKYFGEKFGIKEMKAAFANHEYSHLTNFSRIFIRNNSLLKRNTQDDSQIALDASNLERVLKRIFQDEKIKREMIEILQVLVPGFDSIEIKSEELSGTDSLLVYEKSLKKPLTKRLISDGTFNILAILAAIYQSDRPQFLCIEEPENGLNPKVVKELVAIIRNQCQDKGHYIWINTHSQTLVSELLPEEIILVDKVNGMTQTKQVSGMNLHGLKMDEALLTNSLGGGIPW